MWHLERPTYKDLSDYVKLVVGRVKTRINNHRGNNLETYWCNYLLPRDEQGNENTDLLEEILISEPRKLFSLNTKVMNGLLSQLQAAGLLPYPQFPFYYSEKQLRSYIREKNKRNPIRPVCIDKYDRLLCFLLDVFDYKVIKGDVAYRLAEMKKVNTCPYCNRLYIFTIGQKNNNKTTSKVRPQFDHWFPHQHYPLLGLSYYNLIPSCSVCNSSVKGSAHFSLKTHVHPYVSVDYNPNFKFRPALTLDSNGNERWTVLLKRKPNSIEDNTIRAFFLDEIYDKHGDYEVKDIMDFAIKNNVTYLKSLFNYVSAGLGKYYSQRDIYRMLFGIEADMDKTLNRPFSKLKRDVLEGEGIVVK